MLFKGTHDEGLKNVYIDVLVQEIRNSSALAMELHLSCTNSSILRGMDE